MLHGEYFIPLSTTTSIPVMNCKKAGLRKKETTHAQSSQLICPFVSPGRQVTAVKKKLMSAVGFVVFSCSSCGSSMSSMLMMVSCESFQSPEVREVLGFLVFGVVEASSEVVGEIMMTLLREAEPWIA